MSIWSKDHIKRLPIECGPIKNKSETLKELRTEVEMTTDKKTAPKPITMQRGGHGWGHSVAPDSEGTFPPMKTGEKIKIIEYSAYALKVAELEEANEEITDLKRMSDGQSRQYEQTRQKITALEARLLEFEGMTFSENEKIKSLEAQLKEANEETRKLRDEVDKGKECYADIQDLANEYHTAKALAESQLALAVNNADTLQSALLKAEAEAANAREDLGYAKMVIKLMDEAGHALEARRIAISFFKEIDSEVEKVK